MFRKLIMCSIIFSNCFSYDAVKIDDYEKDDYKKELKYFMKEVCMHSMKNIDLSTRVFTCKSTADDLIKKYTATCKMNSKYSNDCNEYFKFIFTSCNNGTTLSHVSTCNNVMNDIIQKAFQNAIN